MVGQQLSTASANAIWARLAAAYDPFAPEALRRARIARLKQVGLSEGKIRTEAKPPPRAMAATARRAAPWP